MSDSAIGVVGSDGKAPIYQPDGRWTMWSIHDIYRGEIGVNKYIPKVDDWVIEPQTGITYIVTDLNNVTFIPELSPIRIKQTEDVDILVAQTNDNYRIYFDKSITPFTLKVDGFMYIYSATATVARIYQGHFVEDSKIISRRYDSSGNFLGHDIPLQIVAFNSHDNYAVKSIPGCFTNANLKTGEVCTVVVFDSDGKVVSRTTCIVEDTTYVSQAYAEQKYITNIFMKSAFIDSNTDGIVNYPVNLPVVSFNPIGVVQYNDGSQVEYPVDGDRFTLIGLDQFVSTIIGHKVPLALMYEMDETEASIAALEMNGKSVVRPYEMIVSNANRSYNVKLFIYPVWIDSINGYRYKAFIMNLDRNMLYEVTGSLSIAASSPSFNPIAYGITQRITFTIDLKNVSAVYSSFIHVQTVDIILRGPANDYSVSNIWEVSTQVPSGNMTYGKNLRAVRDNTVQTKITVHNNYTSVDHFIANLYKPTYALYNPLTELEAPLPTHMEVTYHGESFFVPISEFGKTFVFSKPVTKYDNVEIVFHKQTVTGYLKLSIASLTVR